MRHHTGVPDAGVLLLLAAVLCLSPFLAGCGTETDTGTTGASGEWEREAAHEGFTISVGKPALVDGANQDGRVRWEASYEVTVGERAGSFSDGDFEATDAGGSVYQAEGADPRPYPAVPTVSSDQGLFRPGTRIPNNHKPVWYLPPDATIVRNEYNPRWADGWSATWGD